MASISLCIPAYNAAWCLPRLLSSAQKQLIPFNEILVYDDCSSDNTAEVAKKFGAKVIRGSTNVGCANGKNELAKVAKSDWLHFHDADDDLLPNFTTVAQKWLNKEQSPDIIIMHYHYVDSTDGKKLGEPEYEFSGPIDDPIAFTINVKIVNFALVKKSSFLEIGGFDTDPKVLYNEDRAFYTRAAIKGLNYAYERELTGINYYYRESMSASNRAKCAKAQYFVWKKVVDAVGRKYYVDIAEQIFQTATYAATSNEWKTVNKLLKLACEIAPNQVPIGTKQFCFLYRVNPFSAFFLREIIIKYFTTKRKRKRL